MNQIILGSLCTCIGTAFGFALQIGYTEFKERVIQHMKVKRAFISCAEDFISTLIEFKTSPTSSHYWDFPLWADNQMEYVGHYPKQYRDFCHLVSIVNNGEERCFQSRSGIPMGPYFPTIDYDSVLNRAKSILQSLEE
ncbi:hypothetical protein [Acidaminococcus timonensis]|uniref:hypothetical protein n=1 Tax=Acidaminococcus timonensis TaxID=1871002 RepID=UPI0025EFC427|nr:hypothetical protein [Acidaminococcus timonensis]